MNILHLGPLCSVSVSPETLNLQVNVLVECQSKLLLFCCTKLWLYESKKKKKRKKTFIYPAVLLFAWDCCLFWRQWRKGEHEPRTSALAQHGGGGKKKKKKNAFLKLSYKSINKPWILCLDTWLCCLCKKLLATLLFICLSNPLLLIFSTPEVITRPHRVLRTVGRISVTKLC